MFLDKYSKPFLAECSGGTKWDTAGNHAVHGLLEHRKGRDKMTPEQTKALELLRDALLSGHVRLQACIDNVFLLFDKNTLADRKVRALVSAICKQSGGEVSRTAEQRNPSSPLLRTEHGSALEKANAGPEKYAAVYRQDRDRDVVGLEYWQTAAMRTIQKLVQNRGGFSKKLHTKELKDNYEGLTALPVIDDGRVFLSSTMVELIRKRRRCLRSKNVY